MMDCQKVGEMLSLYLDGEVAPAEGREVGRHLDVCPDCTLHFQELERNRALLAALPRRRLPESLYDKVMREAETGRRTATVHRLAPARRPSPWWSGRGLLAAGAAFSLFVLLALTALGYYSEESGPRVAAAPVVNRHALDSGSPVLGEPPLWTAASYVPGGEVRR